MIVKRQKLFFWGALLNGGMIGMTGMQMKQSSDQAAEAEEQNRQQVKAMNRIAKAAEQNPQAAQEFLALKQASNINESQKEFSVSNKTVSNAVGFAKDLGKFAIGKKKEIAGGLLGGGMIAAAGYGADKLIQRDMKKNNIPLDAFSSQQKTYSGSIMNNVGKFGNKVTKFGKGVIKDNWKSSAIFAGVFGAMPAMGYLTDKAQYMDQIKATKQPSQKQFANLGTVAKTWGKSGIDQLKNIRKSIKSGWNTFNQHRGQTIVDGSTKLLGGGKAGRTKMVEELSNIGKESGNSWTQSTAKFLDKHKKTASLTAGAVGLGVMSAGFDNGEKLTKKAIKTLDKNGFAYQEAKEGTPQ